jgi:hypothetical protein
MFHSLHKIIPKLQHDFHLPSSDHPFIPHRTSYFALAIAIVENLLRRLPVSPCSVSATAFVTRHSQQGALDSCAVTRVVAVGGSFSKSSIMRRALATVLRRETESSAAVAKPPTLVFLSREQAEHAGEVRPTVMPAASGTRDVAPQIGAAAAAAAAAGTK